MRNLPVVASCLCVLAGCGDESNGTGSAGTGGGALAGSGGSAGAASYEPTYESVSQILGGPEASTLGSCAASSCHGGDGDGKAGLNFKKAADLLEVLVDVPACENASMMRVKPGDPDNSWLWIKLSAEVIDTEDGYIVFDGTPSTCAGVPSGHGFGTRMPQVRGSFQKLPEAKLDAVRGWIMAGAPGPG